jgi:DNA-binding transcriptional LysR family regulator
MNSIRLKYFIVVNQTESIRKAAEILHISPAALSKSIKQLESETGTTLLVPSGRGIIITPAGRELARQAQPLLNELENLKKRIRDKTKINPDNEKIIRIGAFEVFTTHFLHKLLDAVPEHSQLILYKFTPGEIEKNLLEHKIDYGITYLPAPTSGILHRQIAQTEMCIFGKGKIYADMPWKQMPFAVPVQPPVGLPDKVQSLDGWPDGKIDRMIKYKVTVMESALELCRQGKAVIYLPSFVVNLHNKSVKPEFMLDQLPFPKGMSAQKHAVYVARRKTDVSDQVYSRIVQVIRGISK